MSTLTYTEKLHLEKLLNMQNGYVLGFSDSTFGKFFAQYEIDIHGPKYQEFGTSKAKKLRAFWKVEPDELVGTVLHDMLAYHYSDFDSKTTEYFAKERKILGRLNDRIATTSSATTIHESLASELTSLDIEKMPIDAPMMSIIKARLKEASLALKVGAYLSVILMCGSSLEAILLGAAQRDPARFNQANASPKTTDGSVKRFDQWSLAQLIDVACEMGILKPDVEKFSHGLRNFRNYIHPRKQMTSGFTPDKHTARLCCQALIAAFASLAGERP